MSNQIWSPEKATNLRPATASSQGGDAPKIKSALETPILEPAKTATEPSASASPLVPMTEPTKPAPAEVAPTNPGLQQAKNEGELSLKNIKQLFRLLLSEDIEKLQDTVRELSEAIGEHEAKLGEHEIKLDEHVEKLNEHGGKLDFLATNIKTHVATLRNEAKAVSDVLEQKIKNLEEKTNLAITAINETLEHLRNNIKKIGKNLESFIEHLQSFSTKSDEKAEKKVDTPESPEVPKH